jgi:hypothetical protein
MIKREVFNVIGTYDLRFKHAEDYELWFRISRKYKLANLEEPLIKYRILREDNIAATRHRHSKLSSARVQWIGIKEGLYPPFYLTHVIKNLLMLCFPNFFLNHIVRIYYKRITIPVN